MWVDLHNKLKRHDVATESHLWFDRYSNRHNLNSEPQTTIFIDKHEPRNNQSNQKSINKTYFEEDQVAPNSESVKAKHPS